MGSNLELNAEVMVWNDGEDSYGTTITFSHPAGLSYRHVADGQVLPLGKEEEVGLGTSVDSCAVQSLGWAWRW